METGSVGPLGIWFVDGTGLLESSSFGRKSAFDLSLSASVPPAVRAVPPLGRFETASSEKAWISTAKSSWATWNSGFLRFTRFASDCCSLRCQHSSLFITAASPPEYTDLDFSSVASVQWLELLACGD